MEKDSVTDFFKHIINDTESLLNANELIKTQIKKKEDFVLDTIEYLSSQ